MAGSPNRFYLKVYFYIIKGGDKMKPDVVQENMVRCTKLSVNGANRVIATLNENSVDKLMDAYEELGSDEALKAKVIITYQMLDDPGAAIMNGENVRDGVASLCMALVLLCRTKGMTITEEELLNN